MLGCRLRKCACRRADRDAPAEQIVQRILIIAGLVLVLAGIAWPWLSKLPLGRLPGDIVVDKPEFRFYFPITTMIIVSVVVSLLLWLFRK